MKQERLKDNVELVRGRIAEAARRSGREPDAVTLVAVTKREPLPQVVPPLVELGVRDLGENYPQELWKKAEACSNLPVRWHLIGHLQGNKAKRTLPLVTMIHAVDSLKLLESLDSLALEVSHPPSVCLQANTSDEAAKHGWSEEEIVRDAGAIAACRNIPIVGLMTMAALGTTAETARPSFVRLRTASRFAPRLELGGCPRPPLHGDVERFRDGRRGRSDARPYRLGTLIQKRGRGMIALSAHCLRGTILPVRAQPGAKKNAVLGERAGALRVAVSAAPERGKANEAISGTPCRGRLRCSRLPASRCSPAKRRARSGS